MLLDLQISVYGMNERIGLVSFPPRQEAFDKPYSQETAHMIDQEVWAAVLAGRYCSPLSHLLLPEKQQQSGSNPDVQLCPWCRADVLGCAGLLLIVCACVSVLSCRCGLSLMTPTSALLLC